MTPRQPHHGAGRAGGAAGWAASLSPLQKDVPEHMAMAAQALRVRAQAASCGVSYGRDGGGTHPEHARSRIPHVYRRGRACTGAVAARPWAHALAYLMETRLPAQALGKDLFFFFPSLNACLPHPQRLAEQRPKSNLKQGCQILNVMYCGLVLSRASWQPSQNNQGFGYLNPKLV